MTQLADALCDPSLKHQPVSKSWPSQILVRTLDDAQPLALPSFASTRLDRSCDQARPAPRSYGVRVGFYG